MADQTKKHRERTVSICRNVFESIDAKKLPDIAALKIERDLRRRRDEEGISVSTSNAYLRAVRSFTRWAVKHQLLERDPTAPLKAGNKDLDRSYERREFTHDEPVRTIAAAESGLDFRGMTGARRGLVYRLAAQTGLRAGELSALRFGDFEFGSKPVVFVRASSAKSRKDVTLLLQRDLAERLQAACRENTAECIGARHSKGVALCRGSSVRLGQGHDRPG